MMTLLYDAAFAGVRPDPRRGVVLMALGVSLFSVLNGVVKDLAEIFPVNQIVFFRNFFALPLFLFFTWGSGGVALLRSRKLGLQTILAVVFTASVVLTFQAYATMPLADATAIGFSQPLIVILMASLWGRERPHRAELLAVVVGMFGVGIMIEPSGEGSGWGAAIAFGGAIFAALGMIIQRELSFFDSSQSITFYMLLISSALIAPTLTSSWAHPSPLQWLSLIGMGIASGACQLLMVRASYHASASTIAPVNYLKMFWAIIIGFLWFDDIPTFRVVMGTILVLLTAAIAFKAASDARKRALVSSIGLSEKIP